MAKKFLPTQLKNQLKNAFGITGLHDRIDTLEQTIGNHKQEIVNLIGNYEKEIANLRSLYNYAVLKEVDLVRYYDSFYFWYTQDISYQWISQSPAPFVIKNYTPTAEDFSQSYINTGNLLNDYKTLPLDKPHLHEQELKHILFLYLWLHEIDFTFIDVGANYGNTAIPAAKFFKKYGQQNPIIAFEPGFAYEPLNHNIKINQVSDIIKPQKIAIGNKNHPLVIKSLLEHSECNSVQDLRQFYPDLQLASCQIVDSIRLEDYIKNHHINSPLFIKIDAEGSDFQVLDGMKNLLGNSVVMLILEYDPKYLNNFIQAEQILANLSKDYRLFNMRTLDRHLQWKFSLIEEEISSFLEFSQAVLNSPAGWTDVLAINKSLPKLDELTARIIID